MSQRSWVEICNTRSTNLSRIIFVSVDCHVKLIGLPFPVMTLASTAQLVESHEENYEENNQILFNSLWVPTWEGLLTLEPEKVIFALKYANVNFMILPHLHIFESLALSVKRFYDFHPWRSKCSELNAEIYFSPHSSHWWLCRNFSKTARLKRSEPFQWNIFAPINCDDSLITENN